MNTALKTTAIQCNVDGVRLDVFLAGNLPDLTRSAAAKLLETGKVSLNNNLLKKNHKTSRGDIYMVTQNEPVISGTVAQNIRLDIVYEDDDIIIVNKPQGMVVHPAPGHSESTLVNALLHHCGDSLSGIGGVLRPGIVHRIDKDTSGLIAVAKNDIAHLSLTGQLASRTLTREYDAVVCGVVKDNNGTIDVPVGRHLTDRKKQSAGPEQKREAITHYTVITVYNSFTHVRCRLETGRTHQIRVHMAYIGHPVLGDRVYGNRRRETGFDITGQCLHAIKLCLIHPSNGKHLEFVAPLPDYFNNVLLKLKQVSSKQPF